MTPHEVLFKYRKNHPDDLPAEGWSEFMLASEAERAEKARRDALFRDQRLAALTRGHATIRRERERRTEQVRQALIATDGNRYRAAKLLGMSMTTVYRHIRWIEEQQQNE